ncbi:PH domain-containing protein [Spelaeicoccus albus]|uniref:PH (Pleckstrin Homology) domain-containing protein n=1 Tax=Spelaeicoccus albus TaxID=1280376 RepID=A0A7Z0II30_9MICO|nr:PH domain-containing protein [Spelaeicoccus albus]NYI68061.1 hypothetical protein [Spelaeicoccus albus]
MGEVETFRSTSGRVLSIGSAATAVAVLVTIAVSDGVPGLLHYGAIPLLFAALVWAIFDRPFLRVSDGGIDIGNIARLVHIPWPSVTDLELRWGLRVVTSFGKYTAWSVPAPKRPSLGSTLAGGTSVMQQKASQSAASLLDKNSQKRRTDSVESEAAVSASKRWESLKDAGHLDNPRLDDAKPTTTWHKDVVSICGILIVLTAIGLATRS